jgi:hypothetical protein
LNYTYDLTSTSTLGYLRKGAGHRHSMTNWLELRRNYVAYYDFYTYILPSTVGMRNFKIRHNTMAEGKEINTVSDEALALLGIENGHKLWDDIWEKSSGKVRVIRKDEPYPKEWNSTVCPQYTRTSKADPAIDKHTEDKRWTQAGINRFNALRQAIIANRQAYLGFKVRWLRQACTEIKGLVDPDVDDADEDNIVDADEDLSDSIALSQTQLTAAKQVHGTVEGSTDEDTDEDE